MISEAFVSALEQEQRVPFAVSDYAVSAHFCADVAHSWDADPDFLDDDPGDHHDGAFAHQMNGYLTGHLAEVFHLAGVFRLAAVFRLAEVFRPKVSDHAHQFVVSPAM